MSAERAVGRSDVVVTVTGRPGAVTTELLEVLRDRTVLANVGHFATEIDVPGLAQMATGRRQLKDDVEEFTFPDGRIVYLLARGEMLNLAAASGHQIQIMDLGFALQAHSLWALSSDPAGFAPGYNRVPVSVDAAVAAEALSTLSTVEVD
jgi:adenosylhomocysteinase